MKRGIDYIGVGVGAIFVNDLGQLFLAKRGTMAKNERGCWEFPGGSVEFGETLAEALKREMREEYGIEISDGELLDVADHILPDEGQHWVSPTYICRIQSGEPRILEPEKCAEIGWFYVESMPEPFSVISRTNLDHYRSKLSQEKNQNEVLNTMKHFLVQIDYNVPVESLGDTIRLHREFLQIGYEKGWLLMSGPRNPTTGGIVVARAPSQQALEDFFNGDPYKLSGLATHTFVEFNPVKQQDFMANWINPEASLK